ncbi:hypothetical protein [Methylorubrum extorquens]|uniref:hypothetical protein n=1 Tax=Methylorubrum extorquens TaxID=408 RepID=UPI0013015AEC|nr:hypothetical protein [Methylorubrum extorquens]
MSENIPPFTISAIGKGILRTVKRRNAYSAMCMADHWSELGYDKVQIADGTGIVRNRDEFRANLPLVKRLEGVMN